MISLELTKEQGNNLMVFMQRVELKGDEALAYVEVMQKLASSISEDQSEVQK